MAPQQNLLKLAERVRGALAGNTVTGKRMFGGVTFLVNVFR
jgi:hypothetical protein